MRRSATPTPSAARQAETFTAGSLEAVREYTIAQDLTFNQKDAEAVEHYRDALRHDPEFGRAYSGLAASLLRLGRPEEAQKTGTKRLRRIDRMTEREKLRTYGVYYLGIARNYDKAIETYEDLIEKYPADSAGYNNLAITHFSLLNFAKALEYGRKAIEIYPKTYKYRANYALYAMYAGDFKTAATTAQALIKEEPKIEVPYLPLAMEALTSGDHARARTTYQQAAGAGAAGASRQRDRAGRRRDVRRTYADAIGCAAGGRKGRRGSGQFARGRAKLVALAEAHAARNEAGAARPRRSPAPASCRIRTACWSRLRGSLLPPAGSTRRRRLPRRFASRLQAQSRAYGKFIEGEIAMSGKRWPAAIDALNAAQKLADLWLVRFDLGLAYFQRGNYLEAASEFEKCRARRGEATALFLDDLPTFRYYATLPYWLAAPVRRRSSTPGRSSRSSCGSARARRRSAGRGCAPPPRSRRPVVHAAPAAAFPSMHC